MSQSYRGQTQIGAMHESGPLYWWNHMKTIMGLKTIGNSYMQGLVNKTTNGDCGILANTMNDLFMSVNDHLPRINKCSRYKNQYVISVCTTFKSSESVKDNNSPGPEDNPSWVLRNYANVFTPPLTAISNNTLTERIKVYSPRNGKWPK